MPVKFIAYDEPVFDKITGEHIDNKVKALTEQEAIKIQKETVAKVRPSFSYKNDKEALEDFMTVNWAWWVEIP